MKFKVETKWSGRCKHCGETFEMWKPFSEHLAYEHDIYVNKRYKVKAKIRKIINKFKAK